jgi:ribosomal protein S18 acetylase RimI-like enzyme
MVTLSRRVIDPAVEFRVLQDLSFRVWRRDPACLNFETSFGILAWENGGGGRHRGFERDGDLVGWARLSPGYRRIRSVGEWDQAPPSLVWQTDLSGPDPREVLEAILGWAEERAGEPFTTSHNRADRDSAAVMYRRGYVADPGEPFGIYLQQRLDSPPEPHLDGYRFVTMVELADVDKRAEVHRLAWDGSTRSADDVRRTMSTWPYRPDLDFVALAEDGSLASSAIGWFDPTYGYGEFEPVGTASAHRGRGVGAALLRFGLARLWRAGATHAVVGARGDDDYPLPRRLYRSVGFREIATQTMVRAAR